MHETTEQTRVAGDGTVLPECCQPPAGPPTVVVLPSGPEAPCAARDHARAVLQHDTRPWTLERLDDVCLIVSELVTNAYRYGGEPGDSVMVAILPTDESVRIEVHDTRRKRPHLRNESDERARGRGLHIVDLLATEWDVVERPFGKAVWAEVSR